MKRCAHGRAALTFLFAVIVFLIFLSTMLTTGFVVYLLVRNGAFQQMNSPQIWVPVVGIALGSIIIGTLIAAVAGRLPLRPFNRLIEGMRRLADGDYSTRIHLGRHPLLHELSDSFNRLADELGHTELLRSDFVNNFSHEFKTPIVSIRGFAKLLRKGGLEPEQQREYLDIIVDESTRLADMATNVLNLTKVENQSILTDVSRFNLAEQLRNCVLLLEKKWTRKGLAIEAELAERDISANEELLKQVWINLLDNAVKFSPEGGTIRLTLEETADGLAVAIVNHGPAIPPEARRRIFDKFWQADSSHAAEGTGIGLSIVRRVVELHKGRIAVESDERATAFVVTLPKGI